ncbi:hypothetical protein GF1_21580 [Desulfolithobacter dissulfuricans]|uniref:Secretin/TonB short N-terminal domain-containing protein n=1 Tax=Desulfolithobacter dissulfuricans TaxID=2795293 RepID=A0A915U375_9BACT|nr:hypothetical protein GF1_21580 [Desulfolithobacter dissulfuricans]
MCLRLLFVSLVLVSFSYLAPLPVGAGVQDGGFLVHVEGTGQPLRDVITFLAEKEGYKIVIPEDWSSIPVYGIYSDVTIDSFLRRVVRDKNFSIDFDESRKEIVVHDFGGKLSSRTGSPTKNRQVVVSSQQSYSPGPVDPETGIPEAELEKLHARQLEELRRQGEDPDAIDPLTGLPMAILLKLQAEQMEKLNEYENDPEAIDPETGLRAADLKKLHVEQMKKIK